MMKLTVLYVAPTDESAFDSHDDAVLMPLARKIPGLQRFECGKPSTLDGSPPPYHLTAERWCDDRVASGSAMGSPAGQEAAAADVGTVATGGPTTLVTEIA